MTPKDGANIFINEVAPRARNGGIVPEAKDIVFILTLKEMGVLSHGQVRQWLDKVMLSR